MMTRLGSCQVPIHRNCLALSALVNALAATGLGLFVYFRDPAAARNRIYGLYLSRASRSGSIFYCGWQLTESKDPRGQSVAPSHGGRLSHSRPLFSPTRSFLDITRGMPERWKIGYALAGIFFLLADTTPWFCRRSASRDVLRLLAGPWALLPSVSVVFSLVRHLCHVSSVALRDANGIRRHQYAYMLVASVIGYSGGATNFPLWYGVPLLPYGMVLITVYTALMAYTIVRYRLMNISVVLNKGPRLCHCAGDHRGGHVNRGNPEQSCHRPVHPAALSRNPVSHLCLLGVEQQSRSVISNTVLVPSVARPACGYSAVSCCSRRHREDEALLWVRVIYTGVVFLPALTYLRSGLPGGGAGSADSLELRGWGAVLGPAVHAIFARWSIPLSLGTVSQGGILHPCIGSLRGGGRQFHGLPAVSGLPVPSRIDPRSWAPNSNTPLPPSRWDSLASLDFLSRTTGSVCIRSAICWRTVGDSRCVRNRPIRTDGHIVSAPSRPKVILSIKLMGLIPA